MEGTDKDDGVNALRYSDKIAVNSDVFQDYVRILVTHGLKNVPHTHICLSCWCLISSSDRGKHKRVGHQTIENYEMKTDIQLLELALQYHQLIKKDGTTFILQKIDEEFEEDEVAFKP